MSFEFPSARPTKFRISDFGSDFFVQLFGVLPEPGHDRVDDGVKVVQMLGADSVELLCGHLVIQVDHAVAITGHLSEKGSLVPSQHPHGISNFEFRICRRGVAAGLIEASCPRSGRVVSEFGISHLAARGTFGFLEAISPRLDGCGIQPSSGNPQIVEHASYDADSIDDRLGSHL